MTIIAKNKKAYFDYEILETMEAGLVLLGNEVKSIKNGRIILQGSYVVLHQDEAFLLNASIPPYQPKNTPPDYDPNRSRKLLLNKKELSYLTGKSKEKGLTIIPLKVYTKRGKIKLEIAVARGKRKFDKRQTIKRRDTERDIERRIK